MNLLPPRGEYDPSQPRDRLGRFAPKGGSGSGPGNVVDSEAEIHKLIEDLASGRRQPTPQDIIRIRRHAARKGFSSDQETVRGRAAGQVWQGRTLKGSDRLPAGETHYVRHVLVDQQWPRGTTLQDYLDSTRVTIENPNGGVFTSRYQGVLQVGFVGPSGRHQGPNGHPWIMVEYRVSRGHVVTAFQVRDIGDIAGHPQRSDFRWLQEPK